MASGPISISRRHVLGDYYSRCDAIVSVPVYLDSSKGEMLGYCDQGLGHYADAFSFHLPDDVCKKLSAGHFTYAFEFDYAERKATPGRFRRVKLTSISLVPRKAYEKPLPRRGAHAEGKTAKGETAVDAIVAVTEESGSNV
ncbi:MAG: hypothetical protein H0U23_12280 [Blastocatellia bacterium]|nr:hypothetical protein [Blastocatellia bacterium]